MDSKQGEKRLAVFGGGADMSALSAAAEMAMAKSVRYVAHFDDCLRDFQGCPIGKTKFDEERILAAEQKRARRKERNLRA